MDEISMDTSRTSCHGDELFANRSPDSEVFVISYRGGNNGKYQTVNNWELFNSVLVYHYFVNVFQLVRWLIKGPSIWWI